MAENGYQELIAFIGEKFEQVDRRFRETDGKIEESRRHMGVLIEAVRDDVRQLAEGLAGTNQRLGGVEQRLDGVEQRLGGVEGRLGGLEEKVETGFAETQAAIRVSYAQLERRILELETNYASMNERLTRLESGRA